MQGLVLWYNSTSQTGIVWCEDQGPLAFLGPEIELPGGRDGLACGDQLVISVENRDDARYVRDVFSVADGASGSDPREIIAGYHQAQERMRNFSVVA